MIKEIKTHESPLMASDGKNRKGWLASCFSTISGLHVVYDDDEIGAIKKLKMNLECYHNEDWPEIEYS